MSEMVERVARAIHAASVAGLQRTPDSAPAAWSREEVTAANKTLRGARNYLLGNDRQHFLAVARAAIAAMREPTPQMIEAGGSMMVASQFFDANVPIGGYEAEKAYRAMIDEALKE